MIFSVNSACRIVWVHQDENFVFVGRLVERAIQVIWGYSPVMAVLGCNKDRLVTSESGLWSVHDPRRRQNKDVAAEDAEKKEDQFFGARTTTTFSGCTLRPSNSR